MPELFVKNISLNRSKVSDFNKYPFNIEIIKNFHSLNINSPVTFLVGENGIGKSTFIESLAISCGMNPEGGSQNFMFSTVATHSCLHEYISVNHFQRKCFTKFFLRAESFYNVISEIDRLGVGGSYDSGSLHECSHGESFIKLVKKKIYS